MKEQFFQSDIASAGPSNANSPCNSSFTGTSSTADSPESGYRLKHFYFQIVSKVNSKICKS